MFCSFVAMPVFIFGLQHFCDAILQDAIDAGAPVKSLPPKGIMMPFYGIPDQPMTEMFELYTDFFWGLNATTRDETFIQSFNHTMCVKNARWLQQYIGVGKPSYRSYIKARMWDDIMGNYYAVFCQTVGSAYAMKYVFGSKPDSIGYNIVMLLTVLGFVGDFIENNSLNYALITQPEDDAIYKLACFGVLFKIHLTVVFPYILQWAFLFPLLYFRMVCFCFCGKKEEEGKEKTN